MATDWTALLDTAADRRLTQLAVMVSLPPLAPFPLVRRVRRAVLGSGTLHLEAELCEAPMVATVAFDGVELHHNFRTRARHVLRTQVLEGALDPVELRQFIRVDDMGLSPLLELEEHLVWAYVSQQDPGQETDRLLTDCLLSVIREARHRILDWAAGALGRLPERLLHTPAAWLLSEMCAATQRQVIRIPAPDLDQVDGDLLGEVARMLPTVLVGLARDGETLSFGPVARSRRVALPLPNIVYRPVTVSWSGQDGPEEHTVDLGGNGVVQLPVGDGQVRLRTLAGRVFTLEPILPGEAPPEIVELDANLDTIENAWRAARTLQARVTRIISPWTAVVRLLEADGINVLLRTEQADEPGSWCPALVPDVTLGVRIANFDRPRQRIFCRPAPPEAWTGADLEVGTEIEGKYENSASYGIFVALPTSPQGWDGPVVRGLVHVSEYPRNWRRWSLPSLTRGDTVRVRILSIEAERQRIALAALDDRSDLLLSHPVGTVVTGEVLKIVPYGVFVRLPSTVQGLLHQSEIAEGTRLEIGLPMRVRIHSIDEQLARVSLNTDPPLAPGAPAIAIMPRPQSASGIGQETGPNQGRIDPGEVAEFILEKLREAGVVLTAVLAEQVLREFGPGLHGASGKWFGNDNFTTMLRTLIPRVRVSGHHVLPPLE